MARTHRLFTVEENPRLCGWGAEIVSIVADEAFYDLDGPPVRITTPHIPLPAADILEDIALPTVRSHRRSACGVDAELDLLPGASEMLRDNLLANVPTDLWIGGKWRKSSDGGRFDVIDPATENKIASVASATVEDAKAAVDAASAAFAGWAGQEAARARRDPAQVLSS